MCIKMLINLVIRSQNIVITIDGVLKLYASDFESTRLNVTYHHLETDVYFVKTFDHSKIDQMISGHSCVHDFVLYILVNIDSKTELYLNNLFNTNDTIISIIHLLIIYLELSCQTFAMKDLIWMYIQNIQDRWKLKYILLFKSIIEKLKPEMIKNNTHLRLK